MSVFVSSVNSTTDTTKPVLSGLACDLVQLTCRVIVSLSR